MLDKKPVLIILSVLMAVFLWIYVTGQIDPDTRLRISNVEVDLVGEETLTEEGLAVVKNKDLNLNISIKGKRSVVNQAKNSSSVIAIADVSKAQLGKNTVEVRYETPAGVSIDSSSPSTCQVTVEPLVTKLVPVSVGFVDGKDSQLEPWVTSIETKEVRVSGAQSEVKRVVHAHGNVSVNDMSRDKRTVKVLLKPLDEGGNVVNGVVLGRDFVKATVQLLEVKSVPLNIKPVGLKDGLEVGQVSDSVSAKVLGDKETLDNLESLDATVDLSDVNTGGVSTKKVKVKLPENVYLYKEITKPVRVTVIISR